MHRLSYQSYCDVGYFMNAFHAQNNFFRPAMSRPRLFLRGFFVKVRLVIVVLFTLLV